jgi:hypothetical protein
MARWSLVLCLLAVALTVAGCGGSGRSSPIPASTLAQIRAEYGPLTYVPSSLPRGFIFTSWQIEEPPFEYLQPILEITFGDNGVLLRWTVFDKRDTNDPNVFTGGDCSKHPYASYSRTVDAKRIYYVAGNHGDSAWTCATQHVGVGLWAENAPGRPSPVTVMRMVATASH